MAGKKKAAAAAAAAAPPPPINASLNKLIALLPMEKLNQSSSANYATRFMPLVEKMMLEFEDDRRKIKQQLREIVGDSGVPRTPKRNPPGALAWKRINEYKQMLDFEEDDVDTTNFLDESAATNNYRTPVLAPPPKKTHVAKALTPAQELSENTDGTLTNSPMHASPMATPPPGPSGVVTRAQASAEAIKKQKAATPAPDMDLETPTARKARPRQQQNGATPKRKGGKAAAAAASANNHEVSLSPSLTDNSAQLTKDELLKKREEEALRRHEEILQAKAENAKRYVSRLLMGAMNSKTFSYNEERKRRVEMNRKLQEQKQREKEEAAKAQDERVRQFQEQQRNDALPFSPRRVPGAATAAAGSQPRTPSRIPTFVSAAPNRFAQSTSAAAAMPGFFSPGQKAVPTKKQKATLADALRAEATPTPVRTEVKRKPARPQRAAAAKKINMEDEDMEEERRKLDTQMKAIREREAKETRRIKEQEELERQRREDEERRQQEEEEKERKRREKEEAAARRQQEQQEESSSAAAPSNATYTVAAAATSANSTAQTYVVDKTHVGGSNSDNNATFPTFTVENNKTLPQGDAFEEDHHNDDFVEDTAVADAERSFAALRVKEEPIDIDEQAEEQQAPVAEMETDVVADSMLSDDEDDFHQQAAEQVKENHPPTDATQVTTDDTPANQSTYDMTLDKVFLPATEENYNVDDLSSNDETDDEENPRKKVPNWATKNELKLHVDRQREVLPEEARERYFGRVAQPSVDLFFAATKKKFKPRSSSAQWNSPMAEPTRGESRLKQLRAVKE
ncbi:Inner centromere protein [Aphelenchoides avenae]|nr:Inner centromere protein [Aphelenchus avenae]